MALSNAQRRRKMEEERRSSAPITKAIRQRVPTRTAQEARRALKGTTKGKSVDKEGTKFKQYGNRTSRSVAETERDAGGKRMYIAFSGSSGEFKKRGPESKVKRATTQHTLGRALGTAVKNPNITSVSGEPVSRSRERLYAQKTGGEAHTRRDGTTIWPSKGSSFDPKTLKQPLKQLARETVVRGASKLVGGKFGAAIDLANRADQVLKGTTGKSVGDEYKAHQKRKKETADKALDYMKKKLKINR